ncbi:MAG: ABC transporter substrate-binding protein [Aestuariivirgaceae bacterium]
MNSITIPRRFLPLTAAVVMLAAAAPWSPADAAPCAAGALAEKAGTAFVSAAKSRSSSAFAGALRKHVDMRSVALFALGKYRKKLPKGNEREFVKLTSTYVARTLTDFSKKFRASSVEAVRCRGTTIESKLNQLGGRPPQKVLWRIKGGRVSDVNVQNVWLAQLLRSNYASVIKKGGGKISALFSHLGAARGTVAKLDDTR